jgi:hypothetical protein
MIVNEELEGIWTGVVMTYFIIPALCGVTEKITEQLS